MKGRLSGADIVERRKVDLMGEIRFGLESGSEGANANDILRVSDLNVDV